MRRVLSVLAGAAVVAGTVLVGPPAQAATPITGRLVDLNDTTHDIAGMTVRLRELGTGSTPGAVVDTDVTASDGTFSLTPSGSGEEFYVRVIAGVYQGGWVGSFSGTAPPANAVVTLGESHTWGAGSHLYRVGAIPAFIQGRVIRPSTGNPVAGVTVSVRRGTDLSFVWDSDVTDAKGRFRVSGITDDGDNVALKFNGSAVGYETGYRDCGGTVVATWGEACASPLGYIGLVRLNHL
jgi:hypothetical protein